MTVTFAWTLTLALTGCATPTPSARLDREVRLPVPNDEAVKAATSAQVSLDNPATIRLSAETLIPLAFRLQPQIKSSYQAFRTEEARYDFFYAANDSLTPRVRASSGRSENRFSDDAGHDRVDRDFDHTVEVGVDRQFFDTTRMSLASGMRAAGPSNDMGNHPFVSADVRYPLWGSREKLERTSEDIFRRNELNDAQLEYIQEVRRRLQIALEQFSEVVELRTSVTSAEAWLADLQRLAARLDALGRQDLAADRRRLDADIANVTSTVRNVSGKFRVELARLQYAVGIPYATQVELDETPFNPFGGLEHAELIRATLENDPEIATLHNAMRNAEVQLDLARRGKWDVALLLSGRSDLEGGEADDTASEWAVSAGVEVSAVDARVTSSLVRQAEASIERFRRAIESRENLIYVDTLEPLIRIETLSESRDQMAATLSKYRADYEAGVEEYAAGKLNLDDLLTRRETLYDQEDEVAGLTTLVAINVAELCSATGKFFDLLGAENHVGSTGGGTESGATGGGAKTGDGR